MKVLVIDVGGSHVKLACADESEPRRFESGTDLTAKRLVSEVKSVTSDWKYEAISLGIPGKVGPNGPTAEPGNLAPGWVGFDFEKEFGCPTRIVNDAAMQALGAYDKGRMLFLGLGTGLGSTLVVDRVVVPLELGELRDSDHPAGKPLGLRLGKEGLEQIGEAAWKKLAIDTINMLKAACAAEEVVIGGGNAGLIDPLPPGARRGGNDDAFTGGFRLWEERVLPHDAPPPAAFQLVP